MTDPMLAAAWLGLLAAGVGLAALVRAVGASAALARDLLHVGAGVWGLGLAAWDHAAWPRAITLAAAAAALAIGLGAARWRWAAATRDAVCGAGERWQGVALYVAAFAAATWFGTTGAPRGPGVAAGAMLALAWGDGLGGFVGSRWGRHRLAVPWAKPKSWEGAGAVVLGAATGVLLALRWHDGAWCWALAASAGGVAAAAEALAPRASDNLWVPAAVGGWLAAAAPLGVG